MSFRLLTSLAIFAFLTNAVVLTSAQYWSVPQRPAFVGGVYVMSNDLENNSIIAYGRRSNGTIEPLGSFKTLGKGALLDGGADGVDPLFSAYSVIVTSDNRFLLAVNAGSASVSVFQILSNFRLRLTSVRRVAGFGPVSVAYSNGIVYVSSIEASTSLPTNSTLFGLKGVLTGFVLTPFGKLKLIPRSVRRLSNRPAAIQFAPDGGSLVVSSLAAGSADLNTTAVDEISVFRVLRKGLLSIRPVATATSTQVNNEEGRSLPGAIGFQTVRIRGRQFVVVAESRFIGSDGTGFALQTSSVSIWHLTRSLQLVPSQLDVLLGTSVEEGQLTACWIEFSKTSEYFWTANTLPGTLSSFSFKDGQATVVEEVAGRAAVPIDLWRSSDGRFLYQLSNGAVDVFEVESNGRGPGLTLIQTVTDVPERDVQGIAAV